MMCKRKDAAVAGLLNRVDIPSREGKNWGLKPPVGTQAHTYTHTDTHTHTESHTRPAARSTETSASHALWAAERKCTWFATAPCSCGCLDVVPSAIRTCEARCK